MRRELALIAAVLAVATPLAARHAAAIEPLGAGEFNVKAKVDLKSLDRADFIALLTPAAQSEGGSELVFYDFADTLCDLLAKESQSFTAKTGIKVKHVCVDGDTASQQLIAAQAAGSKPPADVFFGPNNDMRALTKAGIVANLPLVALVPEAKDLDREAALRSRGFEHGGTVLPFHRNQTVIAYDSAKIALPPTGLVEIFDYAKAHDLKMAVTNPTKGGSGSGFVESALLALAPECQKDLYDFSLSEDQAKAVAARCMPKIVAFFKERQGLIDYTNGNENSIQEIANGVVGFATVWEDDLYTLAAKGMVPKTVKPMLLASGEVGDGDGLFVALLHRQGRGRLALCEFPDGRPGPDRQAGADRQPHGAPRPPDRRQDSRSPRRLSRARPALSRAHPAPDQRAHQRCRGGHLRGPGDRSIGRQRLTPCSPCAGSPRASARRQRSRMSIWTWQLGNS